MYKMVAIDLDGTLLNSYGIVTNNSKEILKKVIEKGVDIILASGRPIDSINTISREIGANKYFIAGNGAIIYDMQKEGLLQQGDKVILLGYGGGLNIGSILMEI